MRACVRVNIVHLTEAQGESECAPRVRTSGCAVQPDVFVCVGVAKCVTNLDGINIVCILLRYLYWCFVGCAHTHVQQQSPGTSASVEACFGA